MALNNVEERYPYGWGNLWIPLSSIIAHICLGGDIHFAMMHVELAMCETLMCDQITEQERALILGGNIQCLFELGD